MAQVPIEFYDESCNYEVGVSRKAEFLQYLNVNADYYVSDRELRGKLKPGFVHDWVTQYYRNHGETQIEGRHRLLDRIAALLFTPFLIAAVGLAKNYREESSDPHLGRVMNPLELLALSLIQTSVLMNDQIKRMSSVGNKAAVVGLRALQVVFNAVLTAPAFLLGCATMHAWRLMSVFVSALAATAVATGQSIGRFFANKRSGATSNLAQPLLDSSSLSFSPVIEP